MRILMVCLGNICRSTLAEGILQHKADAQGLDWQVDSAGTGNWHAGSPPDSRSIKVGKKYGVDILGQRARQIKETDLDTFDVIYAMDKSNLRNLQNMARTDAQRAKIRLIMAETDEKVQEVPDPYYGENDDFELVYQMLDRACESAVERLKAL